MNTYPKLSNRQAKIEKKILCVNSRTSDSGCMVSLNIGSVNHSLL